LKKYLVSGIKFALSLGVGLGLIYWFMNQMSPEDKKNVIADIKRANYLWVVIPPLIGLLSNFFRTQRWRLLLRPLGYNPGFINTFFSVMIMYFLNLIFPRLGEVSRCGILARYENVPVDKSLGTMVTERLMDVICLGIICLGLIFFERDKFALLFNDLYLNSSSHFGNIIAQYQISQQVKYTVFAFVFIAIIFFLGYQARKKGWENIVDNFKSRIIGLVKGVISIKDLDSPFEFLFHTVMIWVCYYLMAYLGFRMFPETAGLSIWAGGLALFFSGVASALTPGGL